MDLPKNITQVGEPNATCKVYVEDYVISYIKQLNRHAGDKAMAVGLYGVHKEEAGITYFFFYGASRLNFLQRESRHLSQAVLQEAEQQRRKFFSQYEFLGYQLLNGEMVEGFYVYQQNTFRYIAGYAQFYEKNDSMLAFMLADRKEEAKPEEFNQEKYDEVKKRQEERRQQSEEQGGQAKRRRAQKPADTDGVKRLRNMKYAAAAVFVLLCVAGFATMNNEESKNALQVAWSQMWEGMNSQQLPDAMEVTNNSAQVGTIITEDKLTEAIQQENAAAMESASSLTPTPTVTPESTPEVTPTVKPTPESTPEMKPTAEPAPESTTEPTPEPVSYTIKRGDTLLGICRERYGSDERLAEICNLNGITNADDIKVGQKIFLP